MKKDDTTYLLDFEFGDGTQQPVPKYFYFNTKGLYSELIEGFHYETVGCCDECIKWLRPPGDMQITCTEDFRIVPARGFLYATINDAGKLDVISQFGENLTVGLPHAGFHISESSDKALADIYALRVKAAKEERLRLVQAGKEAEEQ